MIRITFLEVALIATPVLLFFLYRMLIGAERARGDGRVNEGPYQALFLVGAALSLAALAIVVLTREKPDETLDMVYVPPHTENGEIVEGQFMPRSEAIARGLVDPDGRPASEDPDANPPREDEAEDEAPGEG